MSRKFYAIYDLDGTICDDRHRLQLVNESLPNSVPGKYAAYHAHLGDDQPFNGIVDQMVADIKNPNCIVHIWTARPEMTKDFTNAWLRKHVVKKLKSGSRYVKFDIPVLFRGNDDHRSSVELKSQWLAGLYEDCTKGSDQITSIVFYDDREDVLQGYHKVKNPGQGIIRLTCNLCKGGRVVSRVSEVPSINFPENPAVSIGKITSVTIDPRPEKSKSAADILDEMAATFRERNAVYGDNAVMVGQVMQVLFPNGVTLKTPEDYHMWHLFELKIVKLTRFAISGLTHEDSIHDDGVYSAMCERLVKKHNIQFK